MSYQNKPGHRNKGGELWGLHISLPNLLDCLDLYFLIFIHQILLLPLKPASSAPSQLLNLVYPYSDVPPASAFSPHLLTCSLCLPETPLSLGPGRSAASGAPSTLTPCPIWLSLPYRSTSPVHCIALLSKNGKTVLYLISCCIQDTRYSIQNRVVSTLTC